MTTDNVNQNKFYVKRALMFLCGIVILTLLIVVGIYSYNYYRNEYIPKKLLTNAITDISNKFNTENDSIKYEYARKILKKNYDWEYANVSNKDIEENLTALQQEAFKYVESQAFEGNAKCQFVLGCLYYHQNTCGIPFDSKKAVYWWNESANQGYTGAFNNLGCAYKDGIGVAVDMKKAVKWLQKGAEAGSDKAQCNYGNLFRDGVEIKVGTHSEILIVKDIEQAKYWWREAAAQGNENAKDNLQQIYD